jgi:hypothetical protein
VHAAATTSHSPAELEGFWAEASEALLLFPLTPPIRRALLQLMHAAPTAEHDQVRTGVCVLVISAQQQMLLPTLKMSGYNGTCHAYLQQAVCCCLALLA